MWNATNVKRLISLPSHVPAGRRAETGQIRVPSHRHEAVFGRPLSMADGRTPRPPACTTANPTADEQPHRQQHPHDPTSSTFSHQKPLRKAIIQSAVRTTSRLSHVPAQLLCHTSSICASSARGHVPRIIVAHIDRRPQASRCIRPATVHGGRTNRSHWPSSALLQRSPRPSTEIMTA